MSITILEDVALWLINNLVIILTIFGQYKTFNSKAYADKLYYHISKLAPSHCLAIGSIIYCYIPAIHSSSCINNLI